MILINSSFNFLINFGSGMADKRKRDSDYQPSLDTYLYKKGINQGTKPQQPKRRPPQRPQRRADYHQSSNERSNTQQIDVEVMGHQSKSYGPQLIMIGPFDTIHSDSVLRNLRRVRDSYSRRTAIELIAKNMLYRGAESVPLLQRIDDGLFWNRSVPTLLDLIIQKGSSICSTVRMMPCHSKEVVTLTRLQILMILAAMLLGVLPKQLNRPLTALDKLMAIPAHEMHKGDNPSSCRFQKLRCLVNYFNMMICNQKIWDETVTFQRCFNSDKDYLRIDNEQPLMAVEVREGLIENHLAQSIMVDFANQDIGGGVLGNGAVQEEILFAIFPECIACKVLAEAMIDDEAIIISGARRFSKYAGYSREFQFAGKFEAEINPDKSILVAIDAINFTSYPNSKTQYTKKFLRREIHKAFVGFQGCDRAADQGMKICTGKWGCGAFKGDQHLKFLIQWISGSLVNRQMIYLITENADSIKRSLKEYQLLVKNLINLNVGELLNVLDEFYKHKLKEDRTDILEFIKRYVI